MTTITIPVRRIQPGDVFGDADSGWEALEAPRTDSTGTVLKVQHVPDGGIGFRQWDDSDRELQVQRP